MEKIINKLINESIKGVDIYTRNGSTWLIFTESKRWVIELTESKTLWYNFNFFKNIFGYASLDVEENQQYITKWVEDNIINKVSDIRFRDARDNKHQFEDTLENGVKETRLEVNITEGEVDDIIQDGVKHTARNNACADWEIEDTIQNGVKETKISPTHTEYGDWLDGDERLDNIIQNGVKETHRCSQISDRLLEDTIQNGVKETCWNPEDNTSWVEGVIKEGMRSPIPRQYVGEDIIYKVIDKGVKKTSHRRYLQTFNLEDTIQDGTENDYWVMDGCDTPVDEAINNGIKKTLPLQSREYTGDIDDTLENGVKETKGDSSENPMGRVSKVINGGVKEVISYDEFRRMPVNSFGYLDEIIENGIKEIKPLPSQTGNKDWSEYSHGREDRTKPFNDYLNDTLEMGIKIK